MSDASVTSHHDERVYVSNLRRGAASVRAEILRSLTSDSTPYPHAPVPTVPHEEFRAPRRGDHGSVRSAHSGAGLPPRSSSCSGTGTATTGTRSPSGSERGGSVGPSAVGSSSCSTEDDVSQASELLGMLSCSATLRESMVAKDRVRQAKKRERRRRAVREHAPPTVAARVPPEGRDRHKIAPQERPPEDTASTGSRSKDGSTVRTPARSAGRRREPRRDGDGRGHFMEKDVDDHAPSRPARPVTPDPHPDTDTVFEGLHPHHTHQRPARTIAPTQYRDTDTLFEGVVPVYARGSPELDPHRKNEGLGRADPEQYANGVGVVSPDRPWHPTPPQSGQPRPQPQALRQHHPMDTHPKMSTSNAHVPVSSSWEQGNEYQYYLQHQQQHHTQYQQFLREKEAQEAGPHGLEKNRPQRNDVRHATQQVHESGTKPTSLPVREITTTVVRKDRHPYHGARQQRPFSPPRHLRSAYEDPPSPTPSSYTTASTISEITDCFHRSSGHHQRNISVEEVTARRVPPTSDRREMVRTRTPYHSIPDECVVGCPLDLSIPIELVRPHPAHHGSAHLPSGHVAARGQLQVPGGAAPPLHMSERGTPSELVQCAAMPPYTGDHHGTDPTRTTERAVQPGTHQAWEDSAVQHSPRAHTHAHAADRQELMRQWHYYQQQHQVGSHNRRPPAAPPGDGPPPSAPPHRPPSPPHTARAGPVVPSPSIVRPPAAVFPPATGHLLRDLGSPHVGGRSTGGPEDAARWCYLSKDRVRNGDLASLVPHLSCGRLLLHILVRDDVTNSVKSEIVIGCFHPDYRHGPVRTSSQGGREKLDVWMAFRRHDGALSASTASIEAALVGEDVATEERAQTSPLGAGALTDRDLVAVYGCEPPVDTVFVGENDLLEDVIFKSGGSSSISSARRPPSIIFLQQYLTLS